jgi:hypothetical protein
MWSVQLLTSVLVLAWTAAAAEFVTAQPGRPAQLQAPQTQAVSTGIAVLPPGRGRVTSDEDVFAAVRRNLPEVHYENVPLGRVLDDLCARLGTNVVVEARSLADAGLSLQTPISLTLRSLPAEYVVRLVLEEAAPDGPRLDAVVDEGVLRISTARSLGDFVLQLHDIRELLASAPGQPPLAPEVRTALQLQLQKAIKCSIAPDCWDDAGGHGTISPFGNSLLVCSTLAMHREIAALTEALAKARRGGATSVTAGWDREADADNSVWAALQRVTPRVSYRDVTLARLAEDLRRALRINVHVYANALAKGGFDAGRTATLELEDVTAERVLREVLDQVAPQGLRTGWEVRNGVLLIGPLAYLQREMVARVYDVADLASSRESWQRLAKSIKISVEPDSWDEAGGRGSLTFFRGRAVVYAAPAVHREIERLLTDLRRHAAETRTQP